jgi:hypothetical protein
MDIKIDGNKFTITGTLSAGTPSATGKSLIVATTNGFVQSGDYSVSLNIIKRIK